MKNVLHSLLWLALTALFWVPQTLIAQVKLPYNEDFNHMVGNDYVLPDGWTTEDANHDGNTWRIFYSILGIYASATEDDDDWVFTPALPLEAGKIYTIRWHMYGNIYNQKTYEGKWGKAASVEGMTETLFSPVTTKGDGVYPVETYDPEYTIVPSETGLYYVGLHSTSKANTMRLNITQFAVDAGRKLSAPAAATSLTATAASDGSLNVALAFVAPTKNMAGEPLESISRIDILRDDALIHTFDHPALGASLSFTDTTATLGLHRYAVVSYDSEGNDSPAATVEAYAGINVPMPVTNLQIAEDENTPGTITLTWDAPQTDILGQPISPDLITYTVKTLDDSKNEIIVEQNIHGTSYRRVVCEPDEQSVVYYAVFAKTMSGLSQDAPMTEMKPIGAAYPTPFGESYAGGFAQKVWRAQSVGAYNRGHWGIYDDTKDFTASFLSLLSAQDGDHGYTGFSGDEPGHTATLFSSKISLEGLAHPQLSYYTRTLYSGSLSTLDVAVYCDGEKHALPRIVEKDLQQGNDWVKVAVPLDEFTGKTISLSLCATLGEGVAANQDYYLFVDNIRITDTFATNLKALSLRLPEDASTGRPVTVSVDVLNDGTLAVGQYAAELYCNGLKVGFVEGDTLLLPDQMATLTFTHTNNVTAEDSVSYYARVLAEGDEYADDDATDTRWLSLRKPTTEAPANVSAQVNGSDVTLTWSAPSCTPLPEAETTDSFEDYEAWSNDYGAWQTYDGDGAYIGGLSSLGELPGYPDFSQQSWMLLDLAHIIPSSGRPMSDKLDAHGEGNNHIMAAMYSVDKPNTDGEVVTCDDWLISPRLNGKAQTISFYARAYADSEQMQVAYSTDSTQVSSFTHVLATECVPNVQWVDGKPVPWTRYEYALPEGARHFAIRYMQNDGYMLMVDDVTFTPEAETFHVEGYNIYGDGAQLNDALVSGTSFIHHNVEDGSHSYQVSAVYSRQGESAASAPCVVDVANGISELSSAEELSVKVRHGLLTVVNPKGIAVAVYTPDGRLLRLIHTSGTYPIGKGLMIVKVGNSVVKVVSV